MRVSCLLLLLLTCSAPGGCDGTAGPGGIAPAAESAEGTRHEFEQARNEAFRLFDQGGDPAPILAALKAAHALDPRAYGVNWRLGQTLADLKLHAEALPYFRAAWETRPDDHDLLLKVVAVQAQLGLDEQALELLPLLREDPLLSGEALYLEARIHDHQGDRATALALVSQAGNLTPALGYRARSLHARFLMQDGQLQAAHDLFERARQGRPDYKESLKGLADTSRRLGHDSEADHWDEVLALILQLTDDAYARQHKQQRRQRLERLVEIYPDWDGAFKQLADLQRRAGDDEAACATIEAFLAHHGDEVSSDDQAHLRQRYCKHQGS